MRAGALATAAAALLAWSAPAAGQATRSEGGRVEAHRAAGPVTLDGRLDEPDWAAADSITDFRQRDPIEGAPATLRTAVRILYDDQNLYIGIDAASPPGEIVARVLDRDGLARFGFFGELLGSPDDMVAVVLDTYHDRRNAFLFATNPVGNMTDGLIENEGQNINMDWDGVWQVAARRGDEGWSSEIAIPLRTLRFPPGAPQTWGLNVGRVMKERNEEVLWSSWGRDNGGIFKIARAGELTGLAGLSRGANLQIEPYVLGRLRGASRVPAGTFDVDDEVTAGGDLKWGITPNVTLDLTANTDFAQVEADVQQINLTRFSLFFPEKRDFFLENAGIFRFGIEGFGTPPLLLFFSRRIGISGTREVPLLGGARLTGRTGAWSFGALDVVTGEESGEPRTNWSVARVRRNIPARGQLGAIVTNKAPAGGDASTAFGADLWLQPTNKLIVAAVAAGSSEPGAEDGEWAGLASVDFTGDFWGWRVEWYGIGEGMEPALGFVRRTGIHRGFGVLRQRPRPGRLVRSVTIRESVEVFAGTDGTVEDRLFNLAAEPLFESGDRLRLELGRRSELLREPFALRPELVVPAGEYWNTGWSLSLESARSRPLWIDARWAEPGFFDGDHREVRAEVGWAPSPFVSFSTGWSRNEIRTPHGDLDVDLGLLRVGLARSTRLRADALVQYNGANDELSGNLRFHWIWAPGSDFYIVTNLRRAELGDPEGPMTRALVMKLTRLVQF